MVEGTEPPNDISKYMTSTSSVPAGSDPLPGESNDAYVARQKRLQVGTSYLMNSMNVLMFAHSS